MIPGGVTHNIRFYEPYPFFTVRAQGSRIYDADGNEYVDFWNGHGSTWILGHAYPAVVEAVKEQVARGAHYGTCHELEIALAEQVTKMVPNAEMVKFANTGTEALMYAVRLAKTYTGRSKIGKFEGGWHGGYDPLYIAVKPPFNRPECGGLSRGAQMDTIVVPFNDMENVRKRIKGKEDQLACVVVEPVQGAGGCIAAEKEFLQGLREFCDEVGALLIFDEVITGFRLGRGGGQEHYEVDADIAAFGKILGGGHPIGGITGPAEIMERMDIHKYSDGDLAYIGGTFCGNPVTMTAGLTTLKILEKGDVYPHINRLGEYARKELNDLFNQHDVEAQAIGCKSLFATHFTHKPIRNVVDAYQADRKRLLDYHLYLITQGFFFLPGHQGCISYAHTREEIEGMLAASRRYIKNRRICADVSGQN